MRYLKTTTAVVAIAAAALVYAYNQPSMLGGLVAGPAGAATPAPAMPAMPVPVTPVIKRNIPLYLDYAARTESIRSITLQAKVSGYILDQAVADGSDVKAGDLLYRIDPRDFQATLDQVKAQAQRDAASLDYARMSLNRGNELTKTGYLSKDTFDQRTSAVQQGEATIAADAAAVHSAELNLGYTEIRAPFPGRIGRNQAPVGTLVGAGGTVLNTLVQLNPIYVTFNPSETDLVAIQKAKAAGRISADIFVPGEPGPHHKGELTFLDNAVDRTTGTITARATIANDDLALLPGQYVRVRLAVGQQADALLVPQTALGSSQLGKYVYVVGEGSRVDQRLVELGATDGDLISVVKGVGEHDSIISGNLQKIGPGMPVQPLPAKPAS
ncbi:efflux RND transporter periplasmic adaptor subunit [Labrys monachus]|uniref:Multidrug efflux system membrane fusion protein n=1 Tax=Labrys monachus TaxID=217067 RepID=A0ABU0FNM1_9HYPH|nr:efflux RND transporter periplasmic adaptor subunit [Labrys monachus]MDQ0395625.1 multidrug efflux system membrane fusion protein [Labrys monachus]